MKVSTLRLLFRNLQAIQSARETYGITEIPDPDGEVHSVYDIEYLYECRKLLSPRQRQAIELFLYDNIKERDVAAIMQVSETNPIAIYATQGLTRLIEMIEVGDLPKYWRGGEGDDQEDMRVHHGVHKNLEEAADEILREKLSTLPRREKMDVLTPWKLKDRLGREVFNETGVCDPASRAGLFHRAWNPKSAHLNSVDGHTRPEKDDHFRAYVPESGYQDRADDMVHPGMVRLQSACRELRWGDNVRLQCIPCRRFISSRDASVCAGCGTMYLKDQERTRDVF